MYNINFNNKIRVFFIGIGGISMSGMAELLHKNGFQVMGSDCKESNTTNHLKSLGITVFHGHDAQNITKDIDLVVYTAAVKSDNPEYQAALQYEIPIMDRAELIGQIMKNYSDSIAIAGTHGKTTTTSMLSLMLLEGNLDPTISVGGILPGINGNVHIGSSEHFITEACEYTNSYLKFRPKKSIILNVEAEHLDYFKTYEAVLQSFTDFAHLLPEDGTLVINGEIENCEMITKNLNCKVLTYGVENTSNASYDYMARNIGYNEMGYGEYDLYVNGEFSSHIKLNVVGLHNISNSLPAIALALDLGVSIEHIQKALDKFTGTNRRFEYKGTVGGVTIIDDYAHHPTEIKATLTSAKRYPHKTLWCVFQPHTFSRTKSFFNEFIEALSLADKVVLADIYSASREKDPGDISSLNIMEELAKKGADVHYFHTFDEIEDFLLLNCTNGDLLITMGAGDIVSVGESLLGK